MTDIDFKGKRVNKPKEIWVGSEIYNVPLTIEKELCRQVNTGVIRKPKEMEVIKRFINNAKKSTEE